MTERHDTPAPHVHAHWLGERFPLITAHPAGADQHVQPHIQRAWADAVAQNPALHDGPIWSVTTALPSAITVRPDRYMRLTAQQDPAVGDLGVRQLGVKGFITAVTTGGQPAVLIAQRGWRVRTYPGAWECAPAGGVDAHTPLSEHAVRAALAEEAAQELGLVIDPARPRLRAILHDHHARSVELVATFAWTGPAPDLAHDHPLPADRPAAWEYARARWLPFDEIGPFLAAASHRELTHPARWMLQHARALLDAEP